MPGEEEGGNNLSIPNQFINDLQQDGATYSELEQKYEYSPDQARRRMDKLRREGYTIDHKEIDEHGTRRFYIPDDVDTAYRYGNGEGEYTFGLIGDTHLGSQSTHEEDLQDFYDRLQDEDVETVFHAGDISDGWEVHTGHLNEIKPEAAGWDRLLDYVAENYPEREGVDTFFIEGNHDHKLHRREGLRFGELLAQRRDDLHYLGDSMATIVFDEEHDIDLELIHPSGGKPYTAGYRSQTLYRERPINQRPTLAGIGHIHGSMFARNEGVNSFYVGAWKDLTTYGKRKGHAAEIGGWIVDIQIEDGELRKVNPTWIGYETFDDQEDLNMQEIDDILE